MGDPNPVAGVLASPLLPSLGIAVADLEAHVPSVTVYLLGVLKRAYTLHKVHDLALSVEHVATVLLYTLEDTLGTRCKFYQRLNAALRSRKLDNVLPYFGYLRMLLEALRQLEKHSGVVYRGIAGFDLTDKFPIGRRVRVWEVMSVSKAEDVAEGFASHGNNAQQTLLVIETPSVPVLGHLSLFPLEQECLFAPGSAFVATRVERDAAVPGRAVIYLTHQAEELEKIYQ